MSQPTFESILKPGNVIKGFVTTIDGTKVFKKILILSYDNKSNVITCAATSNTDGHYNPYRRMMYIYQKVKKIFLIWTLISK